MIIRGNEIVLSEGYDEAAMCAVTWGCINVDESGRDPIEETEEFQRVVGEVDRTAFDICGNDYAYEGYKHRFWYIKRYLLWENHGIRWKTPEEINPKKYLVHHCVRAIMRRFPGDSAKYRIPKYDPNDDVDPVEYTARYRSIVAELEKEIIAEIGEGSYMGYCHLYWGAKKRILKEKYGIEWKSPPARRPHVLYD